MPRRSASDPTPSPAKRSAAATLLAVGLLAAPCLSNALTIRDDRTYVAHENALLAPPSATIQSVADNLVQVGEASGVYLGSGWVLSAAHFNPATGGRTTVSFNNANGTINGTVFQNPGWTGDFQDGNDFALIQLDTTPNNLPDVDLYTGAAQDLQNQNLTLTGYGTQGNGSNGANGTNGQLRAGQNIVNQIGGRVGGTAERYPDAIVFFDFDQPGLGGPGSLGSDNPITYEAMIADGDSGGAAFRTVNGNPQLVAVNSILFNVDNAPSAAYGSIGGVTTLENQLPWIAQTTNNAVVLAGDVNLNGSIEQADLDAVLANWGQTNNTWNTGDITGDGSVNQADLDLVLTQWGQSQAPSFQAVSALPEPGLAAAALLASAGLLRRRRA